MSDFEIYLRTGRRQVQPRPAEFKFNPWHDPENGRFTFAGQGNYVPGGNSGNGPLSGVTPIEKQRAAQINRFTASKNAKARVPITDSVTLHLEKRGGSVSGKFTKKSTPGSLKFTGTITSVKGKREIQIVGMKWDASIGKVWSFPDTMRIYSNSGGLFSQINKELKVSLFGTTVVHERPVPQRLNRNAN